MNSYTQVFKVALKQIFDCKEHFGEVKKENVVESKCHFFGYYHYSLQISEDGKSIFGVSQKNRSVALKEKFSDSRVSIFKTNPSHTFHNADILERKNLLFLNSRSSLVFQFNIRSGKLVKEYHTNPIRNMHYMSRIGNLVFFFGGGGSLGFINAMTKNMKIICKAVENVREFYTSCYDIRQNGEVLDIYFGGVGSKRGAVKVQLNRIPPNTFIQKDQS